MAKIVKKSNVMTPFAGIFFVEEEFNRVGLSKLIDNQLGMRVSSFGYSYSEIFGSWFNLFFCGGDCAEDIQVHVRNTLKNIPNSKIPSADTLLRGIKELATENTKITSSNGKEYDFNINKSLNHLNIKSLLLTKQLKSGEKYDFDYDNQIIEHEKYDAKRTYKHNTGYCVGVATIEDKIVYVENRDGNANVKLSQEKTLERAYTLLKEHEISVNRSRMDAGSYSKEIINIVAQNSELFYIRANKCVAMTEKIREIKDWKTVEINYKQYQVASMSFSNFFEDQNYRLVVMREKRTDNQIDLFTGDNFIYRCILTNDHEQSEKEIIEYYNHRGSSEKTFDIQNNDFGWKHLPCSDMNYNTVYLIITAMIKNFYNYILSKVSKVFKDIPIGTRLKRFIFRFISVSGRWVKRSRQWKIQLYTDKPYEKLNIT